MRAVCPQCQSGYRIDEKKYSGTLSFTCPKCQHRFTVEISAPGPDPGEDTPPPTPRAAPAEAEPEEVPAGLLVVLRVMEGPDAGKQWEIRKPATVIGRKGGDVLIDDTAASGRHAVLEVRGRDFFLRDLESTNGTYVDGEPITEVQLETMTEFRVGETAFLFTVSLRE